MVDINVHGPWPLILLGVCFVLGVPLWIGYLLGRVRTLDPARAYRAQSPQREGERAVVVGALVIIFAVAVLAPVLASGPGILTDGLGMFIVLAALTLLGYGCWTMGRGVRTLRTR